MMGAIKSFNKACIPWWYCVSKVSSAKMNVDLEKYCAAVLVQKFFTPSSQITLKSLGPIALILDILTISGNRTNVIALLIEHLFELVGDICRRGSWLYLVVIFLKRKLDLFYCKLKPLLQFLVGAFLKKRVDNSHGFSSVLLFHFFFDTPEVTRIVQRKVVQNFKKTPNCTCWRKELNPRNIQYRTRPKGPPFQFFFGIVRLFQKIVAGAVEENTFPLWSPFAIFES